MSVSYVTCDENVLRMTDSLSAGKNVVMQSFSNGKTQLFSVDRIRDPILQKCYDMELFTDVTIVGTPRLGMCAADLIKIQAHKIILATASPFFYELFACEGFSDSHQSSHTLHSVTHDSLQSIVKFLYTNRIDVDRNNDEEIRGILVAADFLMISDIADACELFLFSKNHLSRGNCIVNWCFARKYRRFRLTYATSIFVSKNLPSLMLKASFLAMTVEELISLLTSAVVSGASADDRCLAALAWLNHNKTDDDALIERVFAMVPHEFGVVSDDSMMQLSENERVRAVLSNKFRDGVVKCMRKNKCCEKRKLEEILPEKSSEKQRDKWYVIGGIGSSGLRKEMFEYDISTRMWSKRCSLPWERCYSGAAILGNELVVVGGNKDSVRTRDIDHYNFNTRVWRKSMVKLQYPRFSGSVCDCDGKLYAVGGVQEEALSAAWKLVENSVESYAGGVEATKTIARMPIVRSMHSSAYAVQNNAVFVAGGYCFDRSYENVAQICKLCLFSNTWSVAGNVSNARFGISTLVLDEDLYVLGGRDVRNNYNVVEIFNVNTGRTRFGANLSTGRFGSTAVALDHNILCVLGGVNEMGDMFSAVEVFDRREGVWTVGSIVPNMPTACRGFALACV